MFYVFQAYKLNILPYINTSNFHLKAHLKNTLFLENTNQKKKKNFLI